MNNLTPEQEQKSRDEFEAHYKTFGLRFDRMRDGSYEALGTQSMWVAWRDRHRTICVEPLKIETCFGKNKSFNYVTLANLNEVLQAAGIGVKS